MPRQLTAETIADFRDRLCDVAEKRFAEQGPAAVTIRQLAADLGVSPMTPYRYFDDKDAILAAVRARAFDRHAQALEDAYEGASDDDAVGQMAAVGAAYVRFALDHPDAYKLMFDIHQDKAWDHADLARAGERSRSTMTRHIHDLVARGIIAGDADRIGHLFWAAVHGPLMLHFSGLLPADHDAQNLINGLSAVLWRSILKPVRVPAARPA